MAREPDPPQCEFGHAIDAVCRAHGWTLTEFAAAGGDGTTQDQVSKYRARLAQPKEERLARWEVSPKLGPHVAMLREALDKDRARDKTEARHAARRAAAARVVSTMPASYGSDAWTQVGLWLSGRDDAEALLFRAAALVEAATMAQPKRTLSALVAALPPGRISVAEERIQEALTRGRPQLEASPPRGNDPARAAHRPRVGVPRVPEREVPRTPASRASWGAYTAR